MGKQWKQWQTLFSWAPKSQRTVTAAMKLKGTYISVGEEATCNTGDPGWIPGSGRPTGEGRGCPLQCPWACLLAQLVKNPPAVWESWVRSLGWEDPLEIGKTTTHSTVSGLESQRVRHKGVTSLSAPWKKSYGKPRQCVKKQRHHFAN